MEELKALAESSGVEVMDSIIQRRRSFPRPTLLGEGKLKELLVQCMQQGLT